MYISFAILYPATVLLNCDLFSRFHIFTLLAERPRPEQQQEPLGDESGLGLFALIWPNFGDGHPTLNRKSLQWGYKPLLLG